MISTFFLISCSKDSPVETPVSSWNTVLGDNFITMMTQTDGKIYVGSRDKIFSSSNLGSNWNTITGLTDYVFSVAHKEGILFAAHNFKLSRSTNEGGSWLDVTLPSQWDKNGVSIIDFNAKLYLSAGGRFYGGITVVSPIPRIISSANGTSWSTVYSSKEEVYGLINLNNILFGATKFGIVKSTSGNSWRLIKNGFADTCYMSCICQKGSELFASGSQSYNTGSVYKSTDVGENWSLIYSGNIKGYNMTTYNNYLIYGTYNNGIYISTNGYDWIDKSTDLPNKSVNYVFFINDKLYVGTERGLFSKNISDIIGS